MNSNWNLCAVFLLVLLNCYTAYGEEDTKCVAALRRFPKPDLTYTAKHLWTDCPELCRNSSGRFPTGQFPHPWDCNAFINCFNDDAWVHWCQVGLQFNERNMQCDWPRNANCSRHQPEEFTVAPGVFTTSQWEFLTTPSPKRLEEEDTDPESIITCKDSDTKLNDKEPLGPRPDLCVSGTGNYRAPDCRFYIRCKGIQAYVYRCPAGFVFDPVNRQCDWPHKNPKCLQSCKTAGNYDTEKPKIPATTPKPIVSTTTATHEDLTNAKCNETKCIPKAGCQPQLCKEPRGQFEIPDTCTKFANCWDTCAYINNCPDGQVFAEANGMCDVAWNVPKGHRCYKSAEQVTASGTASVSSGTSEDQQMNGLFGSMTQSQGTGYMTQIISRR